MPSHAIAQPESLDARSDETLVTMTRAGEHAAYAALWTRHHTAGAAAARAITSSIPADDLVAEAFTRIFETIRGGGGPEGGFRPYLYTVIRNTAARWGTQRREVPSETVELVPGEKFSERQENADHDQSLAVTAFLSLPDRWQEMLWYAQVEKLKPREIAPLLGMNSASVAALVCRAKEGLRQAWIQAHLRTLEPGSDHAWVVSRLGSYSRSDVSVSDRKRTTGHLRACEPCSEVADEARHQASRIAAILLPLVLGGGTAFTALDASAGASAAVAGFLPARGQGSLAGGIAAASAATAAAMLVAAAVVAVTISQPILTAPAASEAAGAPIAPETRSATKPEIAPPVQAPQRELSAPPASQAPEADESSSDADPAAAAAVVVEPARSTAPEQVGGLDTEPKGDSPSDATPTPTVSRIDTGNGYLFPIIYGTGTPGNAITTSLAGTQVDATDVTVDGTWSAGPIGGLPAGTIHIEVTETSADGTSTTITIPITLAVPDIQVEQSGLLWVITVHASPGIELEMLLGGHPSGFVQATDSSGQLTVPFLFGVGGLKAASFQATDGTRVGPASSVSGAASMPDPEPGAAAAGE